MTNSYQPRTGQDQQQDQDQDRSDRERDLGDRLLPIRAECLMLAMTGFGASIAYGIWATGRLLASGQELYL